MNEFEGYGEDDHSHTNGCGFGTAPGRGSQWSTGGEHYSEIPTPKPPLGYFLLLACIDCVIILVLCMI